MRKYLTLLLVFVCLACSEPALKAGWRAYCTCDHGGERVWRGTMRLSREPAERDQKRHNKTPHHCATVEKVSSKQQSPIPLIPQSGSLGP